MSHIFISYSHKDKDYVYKLRRALQKEGLEVWIDDRIEPGTTWPKVIQRQLDSCAAFVVVMTENAYESVWVHNEVTRAQRIGKPFFALLLNGDPWLALEAVQYDNVKGERLPSSKFMLGIAEAIRNFEQDEDTKRKLQKLEVQARQLEAEGGYLGAINAWLQIREIDPRYPGLDHNLSELRRIIAKSERINRWEAFKTRSMDSASAALRSVESFFKSLTLKSPKQLMKYRIPIFIGSTGLFSLAVVAAFLLRPGPLYYNYYENGKTEIYKYVPGNEPEQVTNTEAAFDSWGPVLSFNTLFFTSNRDGKAEIYKFTDSGGMERVTYTDGDYASWGPVPGFNVLYFTSNRHGKAEIYKLTEGKEPERVTHTDENYSSWGPALGFNVLYFTSNRDGKAEIYRFTESKGTERITHSPDGSASWGAVVSGNTLFFVSNRHGKAEIYKFTDARGTERVTNTDPNFKSWGPMVRGLSLFFTSDRSGRAQIYQLGADPTPLIEGAAWTSFLVDQYPTPPNR